MIPCPKLRPLAALVPLLGLWLSACTATQESAEERPARLPAQIRTDADRQAAHNSGAGYGGSVPDATPGRVRLGEQASGINSRKRPESLNSNDNNTTTPETRLQRLNGSSVDTVRLPNSPQ
jgi:starvation-inducible outer membrane lipoprotein